MLYKKFLLIICGFILACLILECSLQIISIGINIIDNINISKNINRKKNYISIMCIGESTTQKQYTKYLKQYLEKYNPNLSFNIIDMGHNSYRLNELYAKYKKDLNKYKPDIVIGMIGINDLIETSFNTYSKIKTIYLFNLLKEHTKSLIYFNKTQKDFRKTKYSFIPNDAVARDIKKKLANLLFSDNHNIKMKEILKEQNKNILLGIYSMREEFFSKVISSYYDSSNKDINFNDFMNNMCNNGTIRDEFKFGFLGIYNLLKNNNEFGEEYLNKADNIRLNYDYTEISKKYEKILNILFSKNIKYIAMQYPVRDIGSLKKIINNTKYKDKVFYVSNKDNFRTALKSDKKYEIFEDLFAWDFGHCKEYGNRLIANNAALEITKILKE